MSTFNAIQLYWKLNILLKIKQFKICFIMNEVLERKLFEFLFINKIKFQNFKICSIIQKKNDSVDFILTNLSSTAIITIFFKTSIPKSTLSLAKPTQNCTQQPTDNKSETDRPRHWDIRPEMQFRDNTHIHTNIHKKKIGTATPNFPMK